MKTHSIEDLTVSCLNKADQIQGEFRHYTGILTMHATARLAVITKSKSLLERARGYLLPFVAGQRKFYANFTNYYCGGNASAYLFQQGKLPEAESEIRRYAELTIKDSPRDRNGIFCMPKDPSAEKIWIDVAFAVSPFLMYAGLAFHEDSYIEEAFQQTAKMVKNFRNPENGLLHQSYNFNGQGNYSEDHWSRGNGWGVFALAELVNGLAQNDPRRSATESMFIDLCSSFLKHQRENGMWNQEITAVDSYPETSGTGLILYAFGVGVEKGLLGEDYLQALKKGLRGYLTYIGLDGSVHNCCKGCLCPGQGTIEEYKNHPWVLNDVHAFGPVLLSFGQALSLGIHHI